LPPVINAPAFAKQPCAWLPVCANQFVHCTADSLTTVRLHVTQLIAKPAARQLLFVLYAFRN